MITRNKISIGRKQQELKFYFFKTGIAFLLVLLSLNAVNAQDSANKQIVKAPKTIGPNDTLPPESQYPRPGHVALESALLPGLGQITNRQWYKTPVIYAGLITMVYFVVFNEQQFIYYRTKYIKMQNGDTEAINGFIYTPDELEQNISYYRQNRDELIIGCLALYVANIFDAYVYAHLRSFDISNDLSLKIEPINFSNIANRNVVTCSLKLNFR